MKMLLVLALSVFASGTVAAQAPEDDLAFFAPLGTCEAATNSCYGKITTFYVHGTLDVVNLKPEGDITVLDCTGAYILLPASIPKYQELYSLLLSAFMADKNVKIRLLSGTVPCELVWVQIESTP